MATDGTGCHRCIRAQRDLASRDTLDTGLARKHQNDVGGLGASLEAPAPAGQRNEHGVAPRRCQVVTHNEHPVAVTTAEYESNLGHIGNDGDAVGARQQRIRHPLIGHGLNLFQYFGGDQKTAFFTSACVCNSYQSRGYAQDRGKKRGRNEFFTVEHGDSSCSASRHGNGTDRLASAKLRKLNPCGGLREPVPLRRRDGGFADNRRVERWPTESPRAQHRPWR